MVRGAFTTAIPSAPAVEGMYGPLGEPYPKMSRPTPGAEFRFSIDLWREVQDYYSHAWTFRAMSNANFVPLSSADHLEVRGKELVYRASSLASFMELELATAPLDRLRYCEGKGCGTPYCGGALGATVLLARMC